MRSLAKATPADPGEVLPFVARGVTVARLTIQNQRLLDDAELVDAMITRLDRVGEVALKLALEEDLDRDRSLADWLSSRLAQVRPS